MMGGRDELDSSSFDLSYFRSIHVLHCRIVQNLRLGGEKDRTRVDWICGLYVWLRRNNNFIFGGIHMVASTISLPNVKKMFVPDEGYTIIDADLEKADAQIVAWESGDEELKQIFREGLNLHIENAKMIYGLSHVEKSSEQGSPYHRAKQGVHLTDYGGKARRLAEVLGVTVHEAEIFQKRWFSAHPRILAWHKRIQIELKQYRKVVNPFGFERFYFDRVESIFTEALAWVPQCVPVSCEVLTKDGWESINEVDKRKGIAVWDESGKIRFEVPLQWSFGKVNKLYSLDEVGYSCTSNHRIPYYNAGRKNLNIKAPAFLPTGARVPRTGKYSGSIKFPRALTTYIAAFQGDGHYDIRRDSIQFEFMKERKINRLRNALDELEVPYSENIVRRGATTFYIRKGKHGLNPMYKFFGSWFLELDGDTLDDFLEEIEFWDGWRSPRGELWYSSNIKMNCEWIATIAAIRGKRARWISPDTRSRNTNYRITVAPNSGKRSNVKATLIKLDEFERVGCPTISTGFFLIKSGSEISVTGNSTVAIVTNKGLLNIDNNIPSAQLLLQVHDSLVLQVPTNQTPDIYQTILSNMLIPIPYSDPLTIPVSLAASTKSWGDCEPVEV